MITSEDRSGLNFTLPPSIQQPLNTIPDGLDTIPDGREELSLDSDEHKTYSFDDPTTEPLIIEVVPHKNLPQWIIKSIELVLAVIASLTTTGLLYRWGVIGQGLIPLLVFTSTLIASLLLFDAISEAQFGTSFINWHINKSDGNKSESDTIISE